VHVTVYRDRFGFGIFSIEPHISHCTLSVSGPLGASWSVRVLPTSWDHPKESEYLSLEADSLDCLSERRILRFRLPFFFPGGVFAAIGLIYRWV